MKYKIIAISLLSILGMLTVSCRGECWDRFQGYLRNRDGNGEIEVKGGEGADSAVLWLTHSRTRCGKTSTGKRTSIQGAVGEGTAGVWFAVEEDNDGNPMILVFIDELESGEEQFGWIDCRYIGFDPASPYSGQDDQKQLVDRCEAIDVDD